MASANWIRPAPRPPVTSTICGTRRFRAPRGRRTGPRPLPCRPTRRRPRHPAAPHHVPCGGAVDGSRARHRGKVGQRSGHVGPQLPKVPGLRLEMGLDPVSGGPGVVGPLSREQLVAQHAEEVHVGELGGLLRPGVVRGSGSAGPQELPGSWSDGWTPRPPGSRTAAIPKSVRRARPLSSSQRTLPGRTSRWTMCFSWAAASADATSRRTVVRLGHRQAPLGLDPLLHGAPLHVLHDQIGRLVRQATEAGHRWRPVRLAGHGRGAGELHLQGRI